jgi:succinate dehydrogenase/fumarate reductase flavoprotein subunit
MQKITKRNTVFLLALLPLVLALFVSCSSAPTTGMFVADEAGESWNAKVDETIKEPERAAELKGLGQQLIDVSISIQQDIADFNQKAMALNENHDATHEEFQRLMDELSEKRAPKYAEYRDIIFAMRGEVSADEWKALNK